MTPFLAKAGAAGRKMTAALQHCGRLQTGSITAWSKGWNKGWGKFGK